MTHKAIVVDDSEDIQKLLSTTLELLNIKVLGKAYNGLEAVNLYTKFKPDIVFLDMMMPKYDGMYALKELKKINSDVKIIVITADARAETRKILDEFGAIVVCKPFKFEDIKQSLESVEANVVSK